MANDWRIVTTGDGSCSLDSSSLGEHYHSLFGALAESRHVYVDNGLRIMAPTRIDLLEVGLGSGLNALLAWEHAESRKLCIRYVALEPYPVPEEQLLCMDHPSAMDAPELRAGYHRMMKAASGEKVQLSACFSFTMLNTGIQALDLRESFDLVFYDAFAPSVQPEMWTLETFARLFRAMRPDAVLVTYCAKGAVRRTLMEAGFRVERLPGPPGKHEMLRARKM
jgi:tRNA U34 5-methylaminomethyl-2-thiouridine-forming methyltransferase MnmC